MFSAAENEASWRDRALGRSLEPARARSAERLERLIGAARDLANETGSAAFTVAQVTTRAGLSLKSFYRCFAGKDDLLVALLEEDSRIGAMLLAEAIGGHRDPAQRLRAYVTGLFDLLRHPGAMGYAGMLVREHRRLSEVRPDDLDRALAPMIAVLEAELAAASTPRTGFDASRDARRVFALLLEGIHNVTLGRVDPCDEADAAWSFLWAGLSRSFSDQGAHV
ncbi:MAG: TetR/AcrR family transcriptional regulator [Actinobacteria bacterium]|nr:TetR/AcrR family transcriptional regulator [Actinomycetota bacterium]